MDEPIRIDGNHQVFTNEWKALTEFLDCRIASRVYSLTVQGFQLTDIAQLVETEINELIEKLEEYLQFMFVIHLQIVKDVDQKDKISWKYEYDFGHDEDSDDAVRSTHVH